MAANNWTICPICQAKQDSESEARMAKVGASYGMVIASEYLEMLKTAESANAKELEHTFREDYEMGMRDSVFFVTYRGSCSVCSSYFEFEYSDGNSCHKNSSNRYQI